MITGKEQSARVLFDEVAAAYEATTRVRVYSTASLTFRRREQEVVTLIDRVAEAEAALEFGMGPAVYLEPCLNRGMSYHGIDFSPEMVARGRSKARPGTSFEVGDHDVLERHAGRYDLVLAIGLIDYLERPAETLELLAGCLRERGGLVVSFRNRYSVPRVLRDAARRLASGIPAIRRSRPRSAFSSGVYEKSFSWRRGLRPLVSSLGLEPVAARFFNCSPIFFTLPLPRPVWNGLLAVDRVLASRPMSWMCSGGVFLARKPG